MGTSLGPERDGLPRQPRGRRTGLGRRHKEAAGRETGDEVSAWTLTRKRNVREVATGRPLEPRARSTDAETARHITDHWPRTYAVLGPPSHGDETPQEVKQVENEEMASQSLYVVFSEFQ